MNISEGLDADSDMQITLQGVDGMSKTYSIFFRPNFLKILQLLFGFFEIGLYSEFSLDFTKQISDVITQLDSRFAFDFIISKEMSYFSSELDDFVKVYDGFTKSGRSPKGVIIVDANPCAVAGSMHLWVPVSYFDPKD